jgi:hypothetical protein
MMPCLKTKQVWDVFMQHRKMVAPKSVNWDLRSGILIQVQEKEIDDSVYAFESRVATKREVSVKGFHIR